MSDGNSGASYICFYTSDWQNYTYAFYLKKIKKSSDFRSHLNITNGLLCNSTQVEIYIQVEKFRHISLVIT